jgi:ATP-dependent DNA ligase
MLPAQALQPPASAHWLHEIKHDGFRTLLVVDHGKVQAFLP